MASTDTTEASVNIFVMGQVQGVFFRASTMERAQGLNLTGWVKNLADGAVEIQAEGPRWALEELVAWCRVGPPSAKVENVTARYGTFRGEFRTFTVVR